MEVFVGLLAFVAVIYSAVRWLGPDEGGQSSRGRKDVEKPLPPLDLPKRRLRPTAPKHGSQTQSGSKWSPDTPLRREMAENAQKCVERFRKAHVRTLSGKASIIDGDTLIIRKTKIRLFGIDAPELDDPFGQKSKWALVRLCKGKTVTAHVNGDLSHDRVVAVCKLPCGADLGAEMVRQGLALDWPQFSGGVYRHLEPEGVRRRMFRVARRCI